MIVDPQFDTPEPIYATTMVVPGLDFLYLARQLINPLVLFIQPLADFVLRLGLGRRLGGSSARLVLGRGHRAPGEQRDNRSDRPGSAPAPARE